MEQILIILQKFPNAGGGQAGEEHGSISLLILLLMNIKNLYIPENSNRFFLILKNAGIGNVFLKK